MRYVTQTRARRATFLMIACLFGIGAGAMPALANEIDTYTVDGIALGGTDPVSYFTGGAPAQGSPDITAEQDGVTWRFATAENRDAFAADPDKYRPAYGGWCAYGVAKGAKATTIPDAWTIIDGKLYLNYSRIVQGLWSIDSAGYIEKADAAWPEIKDVPAGDL